MQFAQIKELIDAAEQMVGGDVIVEVEGVEQGCLRGLLTSHHCENPARSMGDQSITSIAPQQGCFSTESADPCRLTPLIGAAVELGKFHWRG